MIEIFRFGGEIMARLLRSVSDYVLKILDNSQIWSFRRPYAKSVLAAKPFEPARGQAKDLSARRENWQQRVRLATAYRTLDAYGLNEGICNHLTALAPSRDVEGSQVMLVIPYGLHWNEVTPDSLVGLNTDNQLVEGSGEVEITAVCIHRGVYQSRPDVRSVMHTHMPYATALSLLKDPTLLMVHQNSCRFLNRLSYEKHYGGLAQASAEGLRLGQVLAKNDAMLMGNHGAMTVGRSVAIAFDLMYYLERAALVQVLAQSTGKELEIIPPEVAKETEEMFWKDSDIYAEAHLEAARRKLFKNNPEFVFEI